MQKFNIITNDTVIYDLDNFSHVPNLDFSQPSPIHVTAYSVVGANVNDVENDNLKPKSGYSVHSNNNTTPATKFYYKQEDVIIEYTETAGDVHSGLGYFRLGEGDGANQLHSIRIHSHLADSTPFKFPMTVEIHDMDAGKDGSVTINRGEIFTVETPDVSFDLNTVKGWISPDDNGTGVNPPDPNTANALKDHGLTVTTHKVTMDLASAANSVALTETNDAMFKMPKNNIADITFTYQKVSDYAPGHYGQFDFQNYVDVPDVQTNDVWGITEKINCGCEDRIGYVTSTTSGDTTGTNIFNSKYVSGTLSGNVINNVSNLTGLSVANVGCNSPISIKDYTKNSCDEILVSINRETYLAHFVDESGCDLYLNGSHNYNKEPICDKSSNYLNPRVPNGWEATGKVEWTQPQECNVVTKKITIKPKTVQYVEKLQVNWYDECNFRGHLGYITRNVVENQVTGDKIYDKWDNSHIKFSECIPFVGQFIQEGLDNNGEWRDLVMDMDWYLINEQVNETCNELHVNVKHSLNECDYIAVETQILDLELRQYTTPMKSCGVTRLTGLRRLKGVR